MNRSSMKFVLFAACFASAGLIPTFSLAQRAQPGRQRTQFDADWKFQMGETGASSGIPLVHWKYKDTKGKANELPDADHEPAALAREAAPGEDTFHGKHGFQWFRTTLPEMKKTGRILKFDNIDDNATVYLNGKKLAYHEGWSEPFSVPLDSAWNAGGSNSLAVLVENTNGGGGLGKAYLDTEEVAPPEVRMAENYDDRSWRKIHLPHDFVVEQPFNQNTDPSHGSLPTGVGWYRKSFTLTKEDAGKRLNLQFDGVYRNSSVWLNGKLLGEQKSGYIGFKYDISNLIRTDRANTIVVRADARAQEGWWYEGGGIYRHVWLEKTDALHLDRESVFVNAQPKEDGTADIAISATILNETKSGEKCRFTNLILAPDGSQVAKISVDTGVPPHSNSQYKPRIVIPDAQLWSIDSPKLYKLISLVEKGGRVVDRLETGFGVRSIRFDADKGFFLNGKPVKIKGTCNHQDFAGVGIAMPDSLLEWRIKKLKEMGSNAYRCSHNPPAAELLDACDRLGMIVMEETRHLGDTYGAKSSENTKFDDLSDLKAMVLRDRNHPSIVIWSMCNEEGIQGSDAGAKIFAAMMKTTKALDPTRPVSCAMNGGWGTGISLVQDLQGCNYNPGGYDSYHRQFPNTPMYGSETASEVGTRGEYENDTTRGYVSAYSVNAPPWAQTCEVAWKALGERDFMAGGFVWTGFDYKGEPTPYGWPCVNSHFGVMDECGFPKDAYYYYQAWWSDKNVVHLLPHWNWKGKEGLPVDVWCHSNAETVELFLNGTSLGMKTMPKLGHLEWKVPYAPGKLEAKGYRNGKLVGTDIVETTGEATQIVLSPDRKTLKANGEEVVMATVSLLDSKGRVVPFASNEITFEATGAGSVAGVGNGDPSCHEPDRASKRSAYHGLCMALIQSGEHSGRIVVTATSPGLKSASIVLQTN